MEKNDKCYHINLFDSDGNFVRGFLESFDSYCKALDYARLLYRVYHAKAVIVIPFNAVY